MVYLDVSLHVTFLVKYQIECQELTGVVEVRFCTRVTRFHQVPIYFKFDMTLTLYFSSLLQYDFNRFRN